MASKEGAGGAMKSPTPSAWSLKPQPGPALLHSKQASNQFLLFEDSSPHHNLEGSLHVRPHTGATSCLEVVSQPGRGRCVPVDLSRLQGSRGKKRLSPRNELQYQKQTHNTRKMKVASSRTKKNILAMLKPQSGAARTSRQSPNRCQHQKFCIAIFLLED